MATTPIPITSLPAATTPLAGSEIVALVQGGVTKQTAVSNVVVSASTVPNNSAYAVSAGAIEVYRREYQNNTGTTFANGLYTFATLPAPTTTTHWLQNTANGLAIDYISNTIFIKYPSVVELSFIVNGTGNIASNSLRVAADLSNTATPNNIYGASCFLTTGAGYPDTGISLSAFTGQLVDTYADQWGPLLYVASNQAGTVFTLNQYTITATVLAVNGVILTATVNTGGTGYAVGDYLYTTQYIRAIFKVLTVSGGGAVTSFSIIDGGRGFSTTTGTTTGVITGSGNGFKINITGVL